MLQVKPQLSVYGRWLLVQRVMSGRPVAHVAAELGVSRATGYKWWRRWRDEGAAGLENRSSRPHTSPKRTPADVEQQVLALRRERRLGPARIAGVLKLRASTVHRILTRHEMPRLAWLDRPTGEPVRRYERSRPGELVHVDVKKLGAIRPGGGWRTHGRGSPQNNFSRAEVEAGRRVGYDYAHCAVDDYSRLAYAEIHADEKAVTCAGFLRRAAAFFASHGISGIERVMTDNAFAYTHSAAWREALAELGAQPRRIRPYRPQTNGKAERFNRTLLEEWAYARPFDSSSERADTLPGWLHTYNHHRTHTALEGQPPISRLTVNNLPGQNT